MALNDAQAIAFIEQQLRPVADRLAALLIRAQIVLAQAANLPAGDFPNDATVMQDANKTTHPLTGAQVNEIIGALQTFVTNAQANSNAVQNAVVAASLNPQLYS
jgi:hypothetical protein